MKLMPHAAQIRLEKFQGILNLPLDGIAKALLDVALKIMPPVALIQDELHRLGQREFFSEQLFSTLLRLLVSLGEIPEEAADLSKRLFFALGQRQGELLQTAGIAFDHRHRFADSLPKIAKDHLSGRAHTAELADPRFTAGDFLVDESFQPTKASAREVARFEFGFESLLSRNGEYGTRLTQPLENRLFQMPHN